MDRDPPASEARLPTLSGTDARVVLVCDDDSSITHFVAKVAGRLGVACHEAGSAEAIEVLAQAHPDALMFLDLSLGNGDAVQVLQFLKEQGFAGSLVLISGHEQVVLDNVVAIGARHGLTMLQPLRKPVTADALREILVREGLASAPRLPGAQSEQLALASAWTDRPVPRPATHELDEVKDALGADLQLWYQPTVSLSDYRATGIETRGRVFRTDRAEDLRLVLDRLAEPDAARVTRCLVAQARADWERLAEQGLNLRFSLEVPTREVLSGRFCEAVRTHWTSDPRWPGLLIEIQEDCLDACFDTLRDELIRLRLYKVDFAISDLGRVARRYRSYKRLRIGELQLNRSYVQGCAEDPYKASVCEASVELGRRLGTSVTARGIEDTADLALLRSHGFARGQGDLIAAAVSFDHLAGLLRPGTPLYQPRA
jgi:EAL domain-containing protein (putative c-di-GMP-specific phosphodiesterase class I)/ActR/RegA family two-component response regulator